MRSVQSPQSVADAILTSLAGQVYQCTATNSAGGQSNRGCPVITSTTRPQAMGKFDWGVWYVIIFLYVQFRIRLAAVSKRSKKVRTVAFPVVRSVNKSRDTRYCAPKQARVCELCHLHHSFILQSPRINSVLSDIANFNRLEDGHCDATGNRKMSVLGTTGAMVTTHENP